MRHSIRGVAAALLLLAAPAFAEQNLLDAAHALERAFDG